MFRVESTGLSKGSDGRYERNRGVKDNSKAEKQE